MYICVPIIGGFLGEQGGFVFIHNTFVPLIGKRLNENKELIPCQTFYFYSFIFEMPHLT